GGLEAVEEALAHAFQVRRAGLRQQLLTAVGQDREAAAAVRVAGVALEQAVALQAVDEPRRARAAQQHAVGQLGHAAPAAGRGLEVDQDLVGGQRKPVRGQQLCVERLHERAVHPQETSPRAELRSGELAQRHLGRRREARIGRCRAGAHVRLRSLSGPHDSCTCKFCRYASSERPVISGGCSIPSSASAVGATSARMPSPDSESAPAVTTKGTGFRECAVSGDPSSSSISSALPWSAVTMQAPPAAWTVSSTRPRHSSTASTAFTAASITPVWPTMSALAKLMIAKAGASASKRSTNASVAS